MKIDTFKRSRIKLSFTIAFVPIFLLLFARNSYASEYEDFGIQQQKKQVTGVIADNYNEPLIGVNIIEKGTTNGTVTDIDGNYSLSVDENAVLQVSYIGYLTQEVNTAGSTVVNITLQEDSQALDELVVVGYGVQKKVNLTGSVASIGSQKLENRPMVNLSSGLGGLAAGVQVRQSSGKPGSDGANILVRGTGTFQGSNSPMIVIDGVVVDEGNAINSVNSEDVESVTILKDAASAAIYGSRAANGVVLITTKGGRQGTKPKFSYSSLFARSDVSSKFRLESNTAEWMEMHNRAVINVNPSGVVSDPSLLPYRPFDIAMWRAASRNPNGTDNEWGVPNYLAYPNTDWTDYFYFPSFFHKHTIQAVGGGDNSTYLLSAGYQSNPGTMPNTSLEEYSMRANVETTVADFLKIGTRTFYTHRHGDVADSSTEGALSFINQMVPAMTPEYNGRYGALEDPNLNASMNPQNMENPMARLQMKNGKHLTSRLNTTWYVGAELFEGLHAEIKYNYQDANWDQREHDVNIQRYSFRTNEVMAEYNANLSFATTHRSYTRQVASNLIGTLNYNKTFGDHDISALLGYEQTYWNYNGFNASRRGLLDYSITDITTGIEMSAIGGSYERDYAMISQFGRINYSYLGKYLFEANFRRDGSSRFAPDHRYGVFPSVSFGWRLEQESFFEPLRHVIDGFKLKGSWGQLGNVTSSYYAWQALYSATNVVLDQSETKGLFPSQLPNTSLTWEHVTTSNIGFDAQFLRQRLNVEFELYNRLTEGILTTPTAYATRGDITIPMENAASVRNRGYELTAGWNDKIGNVRYSVTGNFSFNQNRVMEYLGEVEYGYDNADFDVWGNPVWKYLNYSALNGRPEGHMLGEQFLQTPYSGTATYTHSDGSVDPNGGPRDGRIRTSRDLQWVRDMVSAGYKFNSQTTAAVGRDRSWYGEYIFADNNGDGNYGNEYDRVWTGKSSTPKYNFGIQLAAEWKGFDVAMLWSGQAGMYYHLYGNGLNNPVIPLIQSTIPAGARDSFYFFDETEYASPEDDPNSNYLTALYPRLKTSGGTHQNNTDYLYNASYIKLKNLQVGYTLPARATEKLRMSNLRVFFSGENLWTITKFPGVDPEFGGIGFGTYPLARMISAGLNISF
jgi:TonB-linked SusC/RagA family outer membrane protein